MIVVGRRSVNADRHFSLRASTADLAEIDRRAQDRGLTRTAYMIGLACGRGLPPAASGLEGRVGVLEDQVARVLTLLGLHDDNE